MTGLRLAGEKVGFVLFPTLCVFLHFSPLCVFLHFCRDRSLGIVQRVERRNTQGGKGGKQWPGKRGKTGMEIVGGRKSRFCSFPRRKSWDRAPSTGCTCLLSKTKQNCRKHPEGEHSNAIVTVQSSGTIYVAYIRYIFTTYIYQIYLIYI